MSPIRLITAFAVVLSLAATVFPSRVATAAGVQLAAVRYIYHGLTVSPPGGGKQKATLKMPLYQGYGLQTTHVEKASIGFVDGTVVHINTDTDVLLVNPHTTEVHGEIAQYLAAGTNHQVVTNGTAATANGTTFDVKVVGNTSTFVVLHGALLVSNAGGTVLVKTNHESVVTAGAAPGAPTPVDAKAVFAWTQGIPAPDLGEDVALDANGGKVLEASSEREGPGDTGHAFHIADGLLTQGWQSADGKVANQSIKFGFLGDNFYVISDIIIDPAATGGDPATEDLKSFEIRVSSTDTKDESFTTVFRGTCKQQATLQHFTLPVPVRAKYLELVALSNYGSPHRVAVAELEAVATASLFAQPMGLTLDKKGFIYLADMNANRIEKLSPKGMLVAHWGIKGHKPGQFLQPKGVAVDTHGNIYVADTNNYRIQELSPAGKPIRHWGSYGIQNSQFIAPQGIALDKQNNVYVADAASVVQKFSPTGTYLMHFGGLDKPDLVVPEGVFVENDGHVIVADTGHDRLVEYTADGQLDGTLGSPGDKPGMFTQPVGVTMDAANQNIYVADSFNDRIQRFDLTTNTVTTVGTFGYGSGQFFLPQGVAVDRAGNVFVSDSLNNRLQKLAPDGTVKAVWGKYATLPQVLGQPYGIALDAHGNAYITDEVNDRIQVRDPKGHVTAILGYHGYSLQESGQALGQFYHPQGITIDKSGEIFVADQDNFRVQQLAPRGPIGAFGKAGTGPGQFLEATGITTGPDGNVYVTDSFDKRIEKFTPDGAFLAAYTFPADPTGTFFWITGVAVDSKGNIYACSAFDDLIQKLAPDGTFIAAWGKAGLAANDQFFGPDSITIDSHDNLYVANTTHGVVNKLSTDGTVLQTFSLPGAAPHPTSIALDAKGNIYITDSQNSVIYKLSPTGAVLAIWS